MDFLLVIAGLIGLAGGAEVLLRGAVGVARRFDVSPFMIGLTVVAVATSLPELLVCLAAAWRGAPEIILGNIVGSNIANVLLILGT
ncbi:MAG: sodium:calcium antiporter, partial [Pseudomonadota bacterium]